MGRMLPMECEHGVTIDWGDFGPCQGNCEQVHPDDCPDFEHCAECAEIRRATHVFTDAELRARDERIIRSAICHDRHGDTWIYEPGQLTDETIDTIIAAAEAEQ